MDMFSGMTGMGVGMPMGTPDMGMGASMGVPDIGMYDMGAQNMGYGMNNQMYAQRCMPNMNYGAQNMGYGMYPQGRVDQLGYVRYSKGQIIQGLRDYVTMHNGKGMTVMQEEKLEETPDLLRHACAEAKISNLQRLVFSIPEAGLNIPFYFCTACGKLFYPSEFM